MSGSEKINVKVSNIVPLNDLVTRFEFKRTDGKLFPTFSGGANENQRAVEGEFREPIKTRFMSKCNANHPDRCWRQSS